MIELGIDITKRKHQEEELKKSIALNQSIIESTADGILVIDRYGKVVTYNKKFQELWRISDSLVSTRDNKKLLNFVMNQLEDPKAFIEKVNVNLDKGTEFKIIFNEIKSKKRF